MARNRLIRIRSYHGLVWPLDLSFTYSAFFTSSPDLHDLFDEEEYVDSEDSPESLVNAGRVVVYTGNCGSLMYVVMAMIVFTGTVDMTVIVFH